MLGAFLLLVTLVAPEPPAACLAPPVRDVTALTTLAQRSGALSVGLDSIATWCFDADGQWTGGPSSGATKARKPGEPIGDCLRAVKSCEQASADLGPSLKALLDDALKDLERPYLGARYVPRRSGLSERPADVVDCRSRVRSVLFAQAQARMDLARLASQAQSEYANYRTWLYAEGLKCGDAAARAQKAPLLNRGISVDSPVNVAVPTPAAPTAATSPTASNLPPPSNSATQVTARPVDGDAGVDAGLPTSPDAGPTDGLLTRWRGFAAERSRLELDPDWASGFVASRELRDCHCVRVEPTQLVQRLEAHHVPNELEESRASRCETCLQEAYAGWKARVKKQCVLVDQLTDYELGVLERSDDGNGLPPRCLASARARRGAAAAAPVADAGVSAGSAQHGGFVVTRTPEPTKPPVQAPVAAPTQTPAPTSSLELVKPNDYAPIPAREEGRIYVRLFMSSACVAEVLPGPMVARTGDLLPVAVGARSVSVKSSCGGLVEVYFSKEEKPRISENFGRNEPLKLEFR